MADISVTSSEELTHRRKQLRHQRRSRFLQRSWQVISMIGVTSGVIWLISKPDWMLRDPSQVTIEGNQSLSADMIRAMLPINYPQSILSLQPETLAHQLETEAPIADARVTRRMFPPGVFIQIRERRPIATVYAGTNSNAAPVNKNLDHLFVVALLDEKGTWMPYEKFASFNQSQKLPALKVIGIQAQYQSQWVKLYEAISKSPVEIQTIDWREPSNVILHTEIGLIHCGPYSETRFAEQLRVLDRMRKLPDNIDADEIAYIDLSNPKMPMLELTTGAANPQPPED
ncbi:MAG: FtsQ-type POTRA domain-containing protein [Elainella sp. Prado103]|jgi:cell division protein FtsQ|nr:FtsQ-type POTRA domain-containing protein [Elainella sp. Prado103]